jgi:hypothetical protein
VTPPANGLVSCLTSLLAKVGTPSTEDVAKAVAEAVTKAASERAQQLSFDRLLEFLETQEPSAAAKKPMQLQQLLQQQQELLQQQPSHSPYNVVTSPISEVDFTMIPTAPAPPAVEVASQAQQHQQRATKHKVSAAAATAAATAVVAAATAVVAAAVDVQLHLLTPPAHRACEEAMEVDSLQPPPVSVKCFFFY